MNNQTNQQQIKKPKTVQFIGKKSRKEYMYHKKKIEMEIREHQNRTRKPRKTNFGKNGDRVPPTSAMVLSLGF